LALRHGSYSTVAPADFTASDERGSSFASKAPNASEPIGCGRVPSVASFFLMASDDFGEELAEQRLAVGLAQVERNAPLVAVHRGADVLEDRAHHEIIGESRYDESRRIDPAA
jgi:hypothetical protein